MLIFWRILSEEDLHLYEKDLTNPVNNVSEIAPFTSSTGDKAVNYILGTFFILPWISSAFLNPLLFWYFGKNANKASYLFRCLTITDFFTDLWPPLVYTYLMLSPKIVASSTKPLFYTRTWACLIGCFSQIIGFLLAATRAIKIVFPFTNVKQMYVKMYLGGYFVYMILNNGTYFIIKQFFRHKDWHEKMMKIGIDLCLWANFAHCCAGVFISVSTVLYLYFSTRFRFYTDFFLFLLDTHGF